MCDCKGKKICKCGSCSNKAEGGSSVYKLELDTFVPDSMGNKMIVGERYEMYAPMAKYVASDKVGIVWHNKDYSFVYAGILEAMGVVNICTPDISFNADVIGQSSYDTSELLRIKLKGSVPLCPLWIVAKCIRPATDG